MTVDDAEGAGSAEVGDQLVEAIRHGDLTSLGRLLGEHPAMARAPIRPGGRTPLHVATDWPGYLPNAPAVVEALIGAGADPNARTGEDHGETPLHWAASNDDVEVADALLDGGADFEADGGSIGTPLANAVGYGCWHVARRLVERGARVDTLWQAAALGLMPRVETLMAASPAPGPAEISEAFWQACNGGQLRAAQYLRLRGADLDVVPSYAQHTAVDIAADPDTRRQLLATWLREQAAEPAAHR